MTDADFAQARTSADSASGQAGPVETRAGGRDRETRLRRGVDRRVTRRRPRVRRADPGAAPRRCRWPPASSTCGRAGRSRSPSPITASRTPTRAGSCSASASDIPSTPRSTASPTTRWSNTSTCSMPRRCRPAGGSSPRSGRRCCKLAAQRSAGAHPYLTTPVHTGQARELLGPTVFSGARAQGGADHRRRRGARNRPQDSRLLPRAVSNYVNNWKRLGFTDEDVAKPGSDRLIDAVVAHGTADEIANG